MEGRDQFRDSLRKILVDMEPARELLADALRPGSDYTASQISAAQKIVNNAITAADRLEIYERIDAIEENLAKLKASR